MFFNRPSLDKICSINIYNINEQVKQIEHARNIRTRMCKSLKQCKEMKHRCKYISDVGSKNGRLPRRAEHVFIALETHRITSEEVLRKAGVQRELLAAITKRQLGFLGQVVRKEG